MCLRRAVLQIPPELSVPPRLPLYKSRLSLTRPESTLLQVLIPLHFISFISNTYKKPGGGTPSSSPRVLQLVTLLLLPNLSFRAQRGICFFCLSIVTSLHLHVIGLCARRATSATPFPSMLYFTTLCIPRGWGVHGGHAAAKPMQTLRVTLYRFLAPPRLSTVNCRPSLPARNSQARYAIVRWQRFPRTNHTRHFERSEESLFSDRGKDRYAQASKQGAE